MEKKEMNKDLKIFVIIPVFNEEKSILSTIDSIVDGFPNVNIVVVDDGSIDKTANILSRCNVTVLRHIINRGQGASLQTGDEYSIKNNADIIIHFDGDGQHRVSDIKKLINPIINDGFDIVLGSRFLSNKTDVPFSKKFFILKPAIIFNFLFTGLKLTDVHNGLRAMTVNSAKIVKITQDRMAHNTEIISKIKRNRLRYKEVPVDIMYNEYGQGFFDGLKIIKDLFLRKII